jgi:Zn-dependent peptidase ImmA (M78 family)
MSNKEIFDLYYNELGITSPSEIDLEAIALYKGVTIKYRDLIGCEARIIGLENKAIISVNKNSPAFRQRFSIGHELGHWFKHRGIIGNLCQKSELRVNRFSFNKNISGKEKIANEYATEFLMPNYLFEKHIKGSKISFDVILSIKEAFKVSLTAASIKYVNNCDFPVLLVCYKAGKRTWYHKSKYVPDYFYPVNSLDRNSGAYQTALGIGQYNTNLVDADTWIDTKSAENYEVNETSWRISDDEIMAFVWWEDESFVMDEDE